MRTYATDALPAIDWEVDKSPGSIIDDFGQCKDYPAWGESEDGRKWIGTATVTHGEWEEINTDTIELDESSKKSLGGYATPQLSEFRTR